ncbi:GGDEF domain-containing protein [Pontibacter sp. JAM-7]|uniref:GGDEF domain-containing protein n=1 Tax=Pontibacter sp. JAM-7 TaxID=3366581 RepID=UPI003AF6E7DC
MHLPTMITITLGLNFMVCVYMLFLFKLKPHHTYFGYWATSCLIFVLGGAMAASRAYQVPIIFSIFLADVLLVLAPVVLLLGLLRFIDYSPSRQQVHLAVACISVFLLLLAMTYQQSHSAGILSAVAISGIFISCGVLIRQHLKMLPAIGFIMQQVFFLHACVMALEVWVLLQYWQVGKVTDMPGNLVYIMLSHIFLTTLTAMLLPMLSFVRYETILKRSAERDTLTELPNRRHFFALAEAYWGRRIMGEPVALMMIDVDHFKSVNDSYGHAIGDLALKNIAGVFRQQLRASDVVGRIGGEEFVILLPDTTPSQARLIGDRLLQEVRQVSVGFMPEQRELTISIGLVYMKDLHKDLKTVLMAADKTLYTAKDQGRNRIVSSCI